MPEEVAAEAVAEAEAAEAAADGPPSRAADRREPARPAVGPSRRRPSRRTGVRPMSAATATHRRPPRRRRRRSRVGCAAQRLDARPARVPRPPPRLHEAHPAELRRGRRPGPRDLGPAARARGGRPGHRRDLGRDRPVDRLDDGARQRRRRLADEGPVRRVRRSRSSSARSSSGWCSARSTARLVVVTRVPDIVVTLAMSFVWAGCALLVLQSPGGGAAALAQGASSRVARQRVGPEGGRRPARRRRR